MSSSPTGPRLDNSEQACRHLETVAVRRSPPTPTLLFVAADATATAMHHLEIVGCSPAPSPSDCALVLANVLDVVLAELTPPVSGVLLGVVRRGGERIQAVDRAWFRAHHRICHSRALVSWGVFAVSAHGAREVTMDDAD